MRTLRIALIAALTVSAVAQATPSTTFWTLISPDIQARGVFHLGVDNYFTVFREADDGAASFPTDLGVTVGVLPWEKFQMEIGVDLVEASNDSLYGNLKMGSPEGVLFAGSPALQLGIANAGTESGVNNYNIVYFVIGKTIPHLGRLSIAPYFGNDDLLVDGEGNVEDDGFMVAFDRGFSPVTDAVGNTFNRWVLAADYASGDNALGGGGVGLAYYFTKDIGLLTGPVWFHDEAINGEWKWTIQLDVNLPSVIR